MKILSILLLICLSCSSPVKIGIKKMNVMDDTIFFNTHLDNIDKKIIWVTVKNISKTKIIISNPSIYPITYIKVYDKNNKEFVPSKFKFKIDYKKEILELNTMEERSYRLNMNLEQIFPDLKGEKWDRIISIFHFNSYINGPEVISDTLVNY